jgi:Tfp pilus assembly protein FimV
MNKGRAANGHQFLPIGEAALLLGVNRLRLREAIAKGLVQSRRDNEGRCRVDLTSAPDDLEKAMAQTPTEPAALIDALFDEVEELQLQVDEREGHLDRMQSLIERQDGVLERSIDILEKYRDEMMRREAQAPEALAGVSERAMSMLDEVTGKLESTLQENERYRELLARAVNSSEAWSHVGEANGEAVEKLGSLVDRALKAGQLLEQEVAQTRNKLDRQGEIVGKVLEISERAVSVANQQPTRRSWFGWLTGRG